MVAAKAAALNFVQRLPDDANVAIVGFSDTPEVVSPFTTDRTAIATAIDGLEAAGETALYDGVLAGAGAAGPGVAAPSGRSSSSAMGATPSAPRPSSRS